MKEGEGSPNRKPSSLVRFLGIGAIRSLATIIGLDGKGVFLLGLTVHGFLGPDQPFTRCLVQDHSLKGYPRPMEPEAADLAWQSRRRSETPRDQPSYSLAGPFSVRHLHPNSRPFS